MHVWPDRDFYAQLWPDILGKLRFRQIETESFILWALFLAQLCHITVLEIFAINRTMIKAIFILHTCFAYTHALW